MERSTRTPSDSGINRQNAFFAGAVGGLVAGVVMGAILHFVLGMMPLISALVGSESVAVGWVVHLFNSMVFGMVFVPIARSGPGREMTETLTGCFSLGIGHGAILGLLTGGIFLPISLQLVGATAFPVPLLPLPGLGPNFEFALILAVAHLVYGLVLGGVYGIIVGADRPVGVRDWVATRT